jgi:signal peptidase II
LKPKYLILAITVPILVILDQLTKWWAVATLRPLSVEMHPADRYLTVIDGFFRLKYAENTGAAFGIGANWSPDWRVAFFILVTIGAVLLIGYMFHKLEPGQRLMALAISCVLGGAVGNLIDRVAMGKVVDFIDWYIAFDGPVDFLLFTARAGEHHWPTFNIADVGISIGVVLLAVEILFGQRTDRPEGQTAADSQPPESD